MGMLRNLAVLGAAAEAVRRYAQKNPQKFHDLADKAARFADTQTKGKYTQQIDVVRRKTSEAVGIGQAPVSRMRSARHMR